MGVDMAIGFLCGVNGGIATVYVGQPLDTIKVKMQMFPTLYKNAFTCFVETLKKDGIYRGLYAGTVPALAANVAENSVLFCALPPCQKLIASVVNRPVEDLNPFWSGCAGGMAAIFSSFVLCPTELVKCKQQAMREMIEAGRSTLKISDIGPWKICKTVYSAQGFRGFFHGLIPTFAREVPGYFAFFGAYELSQYLFVKFCSNKPRTKKDLTVFETGICGSVAGATLWTLIFPFDVIKSRMQINSSHKSVNISMLKMIMSIIQDEGPKALYSGLGPTIVRTIPATAALFIAVEKTKEIMNYFINP